MHKILTHSAKGSTWKNHKYIRKEGKRYIYKAKQLGKGIKNIAGETKDKLVKTKDAVASDAYLVGSYFLEGLDDYLTNKYEEYDNKRKRKEIEKKIDKGYAFVYDKLGLGK